MRKTFSPLIAFVLVLSFLIPTKVHADTSKSFNISFPSETKVIEKREFYVTDSSGYTVLGDNSRDFTITFNGTVNIDSIEGQNNAYLYNYVLSGFPSVYLSDNDSKTYTYLEEVRCYLLINGVRYEINESSTALYHAAGCNKIGVIVEADVHVYTIYDADKAEAVITATCSNVNGSISIDGPSEYSLFNDINGSLVNNLVWQDIVADTLIATQDILYTGFNSLITWFGKTNENMAAHTDTLKKNLEYVNGEIRSFASNTMAWFEIVNNNITGFKTSVAASFTNLIKDIDTNFTNLTKNLNEWRSELKTDLWQIYTHTTSNLTSWFDRQHSDMLDLADKLTSGYESEEGETSVGDFDSSVSDFESSTAEITDGAFAGLSDYTIPQGGVTEVLGGSTKSIVLVSAMVQSMFESMGSFNLTISIGFTLTIVCMLLGFFKFYKGK